MTKPGSMTWWCASCRKFCRCPAGSPGPPSIRPWLHPQIPAKMTPRVNRSADATILKVWNTTVSCGADLGADRVTEEVGYRVQKWKNVKEGKLKQQHLRKLLFSQYDHWSQNGCYQGLLCL